MKKQMTKRERTVLDIHNALVESIDRFLEVSGVFALEDLYTLKQLANVLYDVLVMMEDSSGR